MRRISVGRADLVESVLIDANKKIEMFVSVLSLHISVAGDVEWRV
jgi:hypothetical protein